LVSGSVTTLASNVTTFAFNASMRRLFYTQETTPAAATDGVYLGILP
jgi:hypothetical protein